MLRVGLSVAFVAVVILAGCDDEPPAERFDRKDRLLALRDALTPLQHELGPVEPGDWLESHPESGQSFATYLRSDPIMATGSRRSIYIQRIGVFTKSQEKIVQLSAECLSLYYGLDVKWMPDLEDTSEWPDRAKRVHPDWGMDQLLGPYILDEVLAPNVPEDAAVLLGFTGQDLWPGDGWNFVFGIASLRKRVGVWSIHRNGDPGHSEEDFRLCLLRTIKTATHETGHMFTIQHCTAFECNMCGSNSLQESDRRTVFMCAECLPKLCWATGVSPEKRYQQLAEFYQRVGLKEESARCLELERAVPALDSGSSKE